VSETGVIEEVLQAEEDLESSEEVDADLPVDESAEDPELELSTATERESIDDEEAVVVTDEADLSGIAGVAGIGNILGVPLFYERISNPGPRNFPVANTFRPTLEAIVKQVQERVPPQFGRMTRISSAGMFVGKAGAHGKGRGCDWDRIVFENIEIAPIDQDHASPSRAKRMRYWAFGAVCRSNCAFVLHGLYDEAHRDHFHTDNMTGVAFNRQSEATVKLLQAVLKDIHGHNIATDGDFGSESSRALTDALAKMNLSGGSIDNVEVWRRFLRRSARVGFVRSLNV
jgi:hypothetical protein